MNINWSDHLHNLRADSKYTPKLPPNTIDHCLPIISAVKLIKTSDGLYCSSRTLQPLIDFPTMEIKHPNGTITAKEYLSMLTFLGEINRSKLVPSMGKNSRLGSLTPLGLYAYRFNFDVPYEAWDKSSKYFNIYLGKFLIPIKELVEVPCLTNEDIVELRLEMQTVRTTGELKKNTAYRAPIKFIKGIEIPAPAVYMLLQLWIANAEHRNTSSMILDPLNWDNIPKPHDSVVAKQPISGKVSKAKEWWE